MTFPHTAAQKNNGREPLRTNPIDAGRRGISDETLVKVYSTRGAFLASAVLSDDVLEGVLQIATAWYDPIRTDIPGALEKHGNPNVATQDQGTSEIAQACTANSCLVEVEVFDHAAPSITCFDPPIIERRSRQFFNK